MNFTQKSLLCNTMTPSVSRVRPREAKRERETTRALPILAQTHVVQKSVLSQSPSRGRNEEKEGTKRIHKSGQHQGSLKVLLLKRVCGGHQQYHHEEVARGQRGGATRPRAVPRSRAVCTLDDIKTTINIIIKHI